MKRLDEYVKQNFDNSIVAEYLVQDINQELESIPATKDNYNFAFGTKFIYFDKGLF